MKRCPQCGRDYNDDSMSFCLDDGSELLFGPASGSGAGDEPATAILSGPGVPSLGGTASESPTMAQVHTTEQTAILHTGAEAEPRESLGGLSETQSFSANIAAKPLLIALSIAVIVLGGFLGYRYFSSANSKQINSIAVLPFENRSGSADTDYLSDGLADSLIYRLSQLPNLKVSPTSSVMRYKGAADDTAKVASELGVDAVMTGRLSQVGESLNISVQLIDVKGGKVLWAEQYDRKMADLLATQREIATTITQKLELKLAGSETKGITKKYTDSNEAYQAYLKGRTYWNRRTAENIRKAIEEFKLATDRDPNFALAYAGLADCYVLLPEYAGIPSSESLPQAKAYAERAIAIDDQLGEPHATLGILYVQLWQWTEAEREYKRAIEINPNYATAYHWYSILLKNQGRYEESAKIIRRAAELDPLSPSIGVNISMMYQLQNNHDEAIKKSLKVIELAPNYGRGYEYLGLSYLKVGRKEEAVKAMEKAVELTNRQNIVLSEFGFVLGAVGMRAEAMAVAKELEDKYVRKTTAANDAAAVYSGLGEKDKAFEWLEKDFQTRDSRLNAIRWESRFEPLRDDPRFKDLLKRMGLPE
ncbi:MAG: tetratricopeptide repeat protein [Chloracidobacterium sp.]|nr:tetratricopeptide repeat protein [Chloracidobacterium sp.]